jgi:glucose/arabinose dehydrogenase
MKRCIVWPSLGLLLGLSSPALGQNLPLERIKLPPGFRIELYAGDVDNARSLALGDDGVVFVGTRDAGKVYALVDSKGNNRADRVITIARGLQQPNGVAYRDGALYVAERSRILRYDDIESQLDHPPKPVVIRDDYPTDPAHGWKFIAFGPDDRLYVPVGAPCNACKPSNSIFATITRLSPDGKTREIFARGVRNTVGFDWHPRTHALWFTDNGRDEMGDDVPDDELNVAARSGKDFGFPYCHAGDVPDPEFGEQRSCDAFVAPQAKLGAHVAALGMRFYTGKMFPHEYTDNIFIAERGSWNRTTPVGYRIVRVALEDDDVVLQDVFASGWLPEHPKRGNARTPSKEAWGRPVDVLVMPDGALLVSDDTADAVYRISYGDAGR